MKRDTYQTSLSSAFFAFLKDGAEHSPGVEFNTKIMRAFAHGTCMGGVCLHELVAGMLDGTSDSMSGARSGCSLVINPRDR